MQLRNSSPEVVELAAFSATMHATAPNTTALAYFTATRSGSRVIDCFKAQMAAKTLSAAVGYP
jgi:hypothetical protein